MTYSQCDSVKIVNSKVKTFEITSKKMIITDTSNDEKTTYYSEGIKKIKTKDDGSGHNKHVYLFYDEDESIYVDISFYPDERDKMNELNEALIECW